MIRLRIDWALAPEDIFIMDQFPQGFLRASKVTLDERPFRSWQEGDVLYSTFFSTEGWWTLNSTHITTGQKDLVVRLRSSLREEA